MFIGTKFSPDGAVTIPLLTPGFDRTQEVADKEQGGGEENNGGPRREVPEPG